MSKKAEPVRIEITSKTILFTLGVIVLFYFLRTLSDLFFNLFISFILMSSLKPIVDWFVSKKVSRSFASIIVLLVGLIAIFSLFYFAIPPLIIQTLDFLVYMSKQLVLTLQQIDSKFSPTDLLKIPSLTQHIPSITNLASKTILGFFGNIINVISIFFFTLYFLLGIGELEKFAQQFLTEKQARFFLETLKNVEKQLGAWMRAMLLLMLVIGVFSYFGLMILGINYALPLAVIAGVLEIFPIIGPVVSAIPAFFVAASSSWILGLAVIALYIIIQQLENNLIVPQVMRKAIGIPPLAVIISVIIGQKIAGIPGIMLAVPFVATIVIILKEILKYREEEK